MARREFQMPGVLRRDGPRPYWYVRYRRKVLIAKDQIERREVWHRLGYCDEMSKREACRRRDEILRDVNREVYTIQSQIPMEDFVTVFKQQHLVTLAPGGRQRDLSLLDNHPTARVSLGRKRLKRERRILSDEEFRRLLPAVPVHVRLMIETAVSTGMRISEILGLKWGSVDLGRGLVWVRERYYRGDTDEPKSDRSKRVLPLGMLAEAYQRHQPATAKPHHYVFEENGGPMDDRELLREVIRPAAQRLGVYFPGFGWHTFRRQNLTLIQEEGATAFEAQAQAGHARPAMTSEYTIVALERHERAVRRVQERLLGKEVSRAVN